MAASLAAAIENRFGAKVKLVEGHNGIYEVAINGKVVYTNQSTCSQGFPTDEHIFSEILQYKEPLPEGEQNGYIQENETIAPFCNLPSSSLDKKIKMTAIHEKEFKTASCGCVTDTIESVLTDNTGCCAPPIENPAKSGNSAPNNCCG